MGSHKRNLPIQTIINASHEIIVLKDSESRWMEVSAGTLEVFGIDRDEIIGKTDKEIEGIYPYFKEHLSRFFESDRRSWQSGTQIQTAETITIDGIERIYDVVKIPIYNSEGSPDALVVMGRDVTGILEHEQMYRSLFRDHPDGIYSLDKEDNILDVNKESEIISGYSREELIGMNFRSVLAPESLDEAGRHFEKVLQGTSQWYESKLRCKDGKTRDVQITTLPTKLNGKIIGIHGMVKDVTEKNQLEQLKNEQTVILAKIAVGDPLEEIMRYIIETVEKISKGICSVMFYEKEHNWLRFVYGPKLPEQFIKVIDKFPVGKHLASCGHASYTKKVAIVTDIEKAASWSPWRQETLRHGFRACWSMPILSTNDALLGTFGVYYPEVRQPLEIEIDMLRTFSYLSGLAIERSRHEEEIQFLAKHDALTNLPNLRYFKEVFSDKIRQTEDLAVMFIDLDQFKSLNDTFGHIFGDMLLQEIAKRIEKVIGKENFIARMGGDEFILLLQEVTDEQKMRLVADQILKETEKPLMIEGQEFHVTASIGVSLFGKHGKTIGELMKNADVAMYKAKETGGNAGKVYEATMDDKAYELYMLRGEFRKALELQQFELHYQPKINLKKKRITGMEALVRWNHPEKGSISPATFIPLAEESGFILELGAWVLRNACRQVKEWREAEGPDIRVAVNVSVKQFIKQDVAALVQLILQELELPPDCLEIEITESVLSSHESVIQEAVESLQKLGVKVSIDDFGTGYASLTYLKQFRADAIKIDQSFIRHLPQNQDDAAIVSAVITLAKALDICIVAEGVETKEQVDFLVEKECTEVQGYYFSKPLQADKMHELLKQQFASENK
ncbi:EAL domain-containing protein [Planococcus shenhongbingii]|uniref:bifunctional diguanylate cyclase/phosphodiesterase n=1 Tax=Planococcus shenhongbingii TaxID=3058398 RepID=UPI002612C877|nr:EAL domain-containing protein [Planococcus sp. N016]WKA59201.1 EAL domain-containing protein [Planococcus sp. N016]